MTEPDPIFDVARQYANETNLETRRSVWQLGPSGIDPLDLVLAAVRAAALAYLASSDEGIDWALPDDGWPREYAGHVTVFVAR